MRRFLLIFALLITLILPGPALAGHREFELGPVQNFGPNLQTVCPNPEGIAIDPDENIYAASLAFSRVAANICVLNSDQELVDVIRIPAGPSGMVALVGELFEPGQGLYVVDFATGTVPNGRLLKVNVKTHTFVTLATGFAIANGIAQSRDRNLFVSDSLTGRIHKVAPDGSSNTVWIDSELLRPHPKGPDDPPFGANGVAFDRDEHFLYVANTADRTILRVAVRADGSAGTTEVFADGRQIDARQNTRGALHGADGIMFDVKGNLFVCANQENEIQVLSPGRRLIARQRGVGENAMDFPASLVFKENELFVSNLSLGTGGSNSKLSVLEAPFPGLPLHPSPDED